MARPRSLQSPKQQKLPEQLAPHPSGGPLSLGNPMPCWLPVDTMAPATHVGSHASFCCWLCSSLPLSPLLWLK